MSHPHLCSSIRGIVCYCDNVPQARTCQGTGAGLVWASRAALSVYASLLLNTTVSTSLVNKNLCFNVYKPIKTFGMYLRKQFISCLNHFDTVLFFQVKLVLLDKLTHRSKRQVRCDAARCVTVATGHVSAL